MDESVRLSEFRDGYSDNLDCIDEQQLRREEDISIRSDNLKATKFGSFFIKLAAFLFGLCTVLPWNAFITATDYFIDKLATNQSLINIFSGTLNVCSNIPVIVAFFLNTYYLYKFSVPLRVYVSFALVLLGFILTIVFVTVDTTEITIVFFSITMITTIILNTFASTAEGGFMAMLSYFPKHYINLFLVGQGFTGLLIALIRILILASNMSDINAAIIYFTVSIASVVLVMTLYFFTTKTVHYRTYVVKTNNSGDTHQNDIMKNLDYKKVLFIYAKVFKKIWVVAMSLSFDFLITLSIFPGFVFQISSIYTGTKWADKFFKITNTFLMYGIGDVLGRLSSRYVPCRKNHTPFYLAFTLLRIMFLVLFLYCNKDSNDKYPAIFNHDIFPIIISLLFSFSHGFFATINFYALAKLVSPNDMEIATSLMIMILSIGLGIGSFLSYAVNIILVQ